ncbi:MAG TPA: peptidoglycan DD-metalloendopeptidase family protein [Ilumatobacteraceae bacterium]|jgi:murein DD-endopeptidase MepM/ murein hydrolase activator NlpD|nr:peptidoglycan DD-metalloendopeptidase family protein [Ilumatobacteraceae bacterium]
MALLATVFPARTATATTSDQVAAEILRIQAKADKTAKLWSEAQIRQQDVAAQIQTSQTQIAAASAHYQDMQNALARIVVDRFTSGAAPSILLMTGDVTETMQMNALKDIALDAGTADLDTLDAARDDLQAQQAHLDSLEAQNAQLVKALDSRQTEINSQLEDLATLRDQLKNAEVKRAYDAQLAKQKQEEAKAAAERHAKAAIRQAATAPIVTVAGPSFAARGGGVQPTTAPSPAASPSADPAPEPDPPAPDPAPVVSNASFICPVAGPAAFGDTYGAPRSGGRKHEGVDMMSPYGTPLVAVVSGAANMHSTSLGGNSISLDGDDGNRYFYAHLSSYAGGSRNVAAGEVIGFVGHTGDTTANHLHFEIHPGGGAAIDPYPTVRRYC